MDLDDVARLALALPGTEEGTAYGSRAWRVGGRLFVWERPLRKTELAQLGDAAPTGTLLGARVEHLGAKAALLQADPDVYVTTPHFDRDPIVLVRLDAVAPPELEEVVVEAWLDRAPPKLVAAHAAARGA